MKNVGEIFDFLKKKYNWNDSEYVFVIKFTHDINRIYNLNEIAINFHIDTERIKLTIFTNDSLNGDLMKIKSLGELEEYLISYEIMNKLIGELFYIPNVEINSYHIFK